MKKLRLKRYTTLKVQVFQIDLHQYTNISLQTSTDEAETDGTEEVLMQLQLEIQLTDWREN